MKYVLIVLVAIITSFFFFPFEFTFLPGINTKMMAAAFGILLFLWRGINRRGIIVPQEFFIASVIAGLFSFAGCYSVVYNNTTDYAYATYIVSMWVWLGAAYAVCDIISKVHGYISAKLVINYLTGVCAAQCILALLIDSIPVVKMVVDGFVIGMEGMNEINRLYGIGALLDVAGAKFAAVLVMIAVLLCNDNEIKVNKKTIAIYVFLFVLIAIIGSMMARTTYVGIIMAFIYIVYATGIWKIHIRISNIRLWSILIGVAVLLIVISIYLYMNVPVARNLLSFGFEGLINWLERGEWTTASTDALQTMWVFPESLKTWIIGDGYFTDPTNPRFFYMKTDIGYLRFIFYCGLVGLSLFSIFFVYLTAACYKRFHTERHLFLLLLILVFVIWSKVSTDLFLVYAMFISIPSVQKQTNNQMGRL